MYTKFIVSFHSIMEKISSNFDEIQFIPDYLSEYDLIEKQDKDPSTKSVDLSIAYNQFTDGLEPFNVALGEAEGQNHAENNLVPEQTHLGDFISVLKEVYKINVESKACFLDEGSISPALFSAHFCFGKFYLDNIMLKPFSGQEISSVNNTEDSSSIVKSEMDNVIIQETQHNFYDLNQPPMDVSLESSLFLQQDDIGLTEKIYNYFFKLVHEVNGLMGELLFSYNLGFLKNKPFFFYNNGGDIINYEDVISDSQKDPLPLAQDSPSECDEIEAQAVPLSTCDSQGTIFNLIDPLIPPQNEVVVLG